MRLCQFFAFVAKPLIGRLSALQYVIKHVIFPISAQVGFPRRPEESGWDQLENHKL